MWGTITNQLNNRIMAKKIYALYRTDNWHTYDSRELLVVAGSIRRCCKVAKDDGATKEQIEEYIYGEDGLDLSESSTYYMCGDAVSIKQEEYKP